MAFDEDFTVFFDTNEFAGSATLNGIAVRGIFDNATIVSDGGAGMATTNPIFTLLTIDVPANPVGVSLVYAGTTYRVAAHDKDGTGVSVLTLEYTA